MDRRSSRLRSASWPNRMWFRVTLSAISAARGPQPSSATRSITGMRPGGADEGALRALIYIRRPDGAADERGFRMLKIIRDTRKANRQLTLSQFREMAMEQLQLVLLDEERAITALPKLLHPGEPESDCGAGRPAGAPGCAGTSDQGGKEPGRSGREAARRQTHECSSEELNDGRRVGSRAGGEKYKRLIAAAQRETRIKVAVAHPCDEVSLRGAVEAHKLGLIEPILVAPLARVRNAADEAHLDISGFELVESAHSHDSAAKAVGLVTAGRVEALMKGSLHTDELMGAVVAREGGIRTERRISHCFIMDVPGHPEPLIITDAAVNIAPDLTPKSTSFRTPSISRMRWARQRCVWRS